MKKILFLAVITVFGLTYVNAQESKQDSKQGFKLGVKSGVNFSTLSGDDADGIDGRTSFHAGLIGSLSISDAFSIQPELIYSAQGAKATDDIIGETVFKFDYINIPVLADFTVTEGFSLQVGPQFGFLINDKAEALGVSVDLSDLGVNTNSFDFGAAVGAQYKLPSIDLLFQARYVLGVTDIEEDSDLKNAVFSLSVGYFFL